MELPLDRTITGLDQRVRNIGRCQHNKCQQQQQRLRHDDERFETEVSERAAQKGVERRRYFLAPKRRIQISSNFVPDPSIFVHVPDQEAEQLN
jgi:hypothetical protein